MLNNPLLQDYLNAMILMLERIKDNAREGKEITEYANHVISMCRTLKGEEEEED